MDAAAVCRRRRRRRRSLPGRRHPRLECRGSGLRRDREHPQPRGHRPRRRDRQPPARPARRGARGDRADGPLPFPRPAAGSSAPRSATTCRSSVAGISSSTDLPEVPHDHSDRDQRIRPHRPTDPAGHPRAAPVPSSRSSRSTTWPPPPRMPTCSATTRPTAASTGEVSSGEGEIMVDGHHIATFSEKDPAVLPWADHGIDLVVGVHRRLHRCRQGPRPHRRRRAQGDHLRARQERGPDRGPGRERGHVRPGDPPHRQQRLVHDQRAGAARQGHLRHVRDRARPDDHRPLVHQRPAGARRRPQGPASRAVRGPEHHPDHHRRGQGPGPGHPRPEGPLRRLLAARPHGHGQRDRLRGPDHQARRRSNQPTRR